MLKILFIDDNLGDHKVFEVAIKETEIDCQLTSIFSAQEAIDIIFKEKFDLIITDIIMPGISGEDFVSLIQNWESVRFIPVIFLSGRKFNESQMFDIPNTLNVGNKIYPLLEKPVEPVRLKNAIFEVLSKDS